MSEIRVNPLSVLTWNQLDLNHAKMDVSDGLKAESGVRDNNLPDGVAFKGMLDPAGYEEWLKANNIEYVKEAVVAGKYPMPTEQAFPTGMGAETDKLFRDKNVPAVLYEVSKSIERPLRFDYFYSDGDAILENMIVHVRRGCEFTLILNICGENGIGSVGHSLKLLLEEDAKCTLIRLQMLPAGFTYFEDAGARLKDRAELKYISLQLGSLKTYLGACFDQWGYESKLWAGLGYIGIKDSFLDYNYVDTFRGKKSVGVMRFNGVLMDNATKVSRETLDFRQYCTGADGDEEEDLLVLGEDAVNKANPMILGEEEDVSGRHAVSVGRLSQDMLFYMQSRGIDEIKAQELMVRSRIMHLASQIPDDELKKAVERYLDRLYCDRENCAAPCC
ncbi:MAG: SufD family Fe-S cluster assembly protein [Lachnospiraceae bacterium]|nr:SufD family Fe-S cluster assembly protein [Lachnospiraceae bacterium]